MLQIRIKNKMADGAQLTSAAATGDEKVRFFFFQNRNFCFKIDVKGTLLFWYLSYSFFVFFLGSEGDFGSRSGRKLIFTRRLQTSLHCSFLGLQRDCTTFARSRVSKMFLYDFEKKQKYLYLWHFSFPELHLQSSLFRPLSELTLMRATEAQIGQPCTAQHSKDMEKL